MLFMRIFHCFLCDWNSLRKFNNEVQTQRKQGKCARLLQKLHFKEPAALRRLILVKLSRKVMLLSLAL